VDRRFALIGRDGDIRFPVLKNQRATNRHGFALSAGADVDRHGGAIYTTDLAQVIEWVVINGGRVRAKSTKTGQVNSVALGKRVIVGYWVSPRFAHLLAGAPMPPAASPPPGAEA
jgi:hypothetical protein